MKIKTLLAICAALVMSSFHANADDTLTGDQIKSLIVGKTVHAEHARKGFKFSVFFDEDGTATRIKNGNTKEGRYVIVKNMQCVDMGRGENCATIVANGNGTYKRLKEGDDHVVDWISFTNGRYLK